MDIYNFCLTGSVAITLRKGDGSAQTLPCVVIYEDTDHIERSRGSIYDLELCGTVSDSAVTDGKSSPNRGIGEGR